MQILWVHLSFPTSPPLKESPGAILQTQLHRAKPRNIKKPTESVGSSQGGKPPAKRKVTKELEQDGEKKDDESTKRKKAKKGKAAAKAKNK